MGLKPDLKVCLELGIGLSTLKRWEKDPKLNFPACIRINNRNFRDSDKLAEFVAERARASVAAEHVERGKARAAKARAGKKQRVEARGAA
jgi:hypothetical protein